jgi:hypothetical protein
MRAIYLLVLIFNFLLVKGDGQISTPSDQNTNLTTASSFIGRSTETKIKAAHVHSIFSKAINERTYDLTEDDVEDEIVFESHSITIFKNITLLSYALALIFILKNLDSRISIFRKQPFTLTDKYIVQRVLRL